MKERTSGPAAWLPVRKKLVDKALVVIFFTKFRAYKLNIIIF